MSSTGMSGTNDMGTNNPLGADLSGSAPGSDPTMGELPPDAVEVVEVVTLEGGPDALSDADLYGEQYGTPGFRWWYVPAAAVPVVAGGALFWYLRNQNRKQPINNFTNLLARRGNDFTGWAQDRIGGMRGRKPAAKRRTAAVAGIATAPVWGRAGVWIGGRLDDVSDLIDLIDRDRVRNLARQSRNLASARLAKATVATKRTTKATKAAAKSGNRWNDLTDTLGNTWEDASDTVLGWWEGVRGTPKPSGAKKAAVALGAGKIAATAAKPVSSAVAAVAGAKDSTARAAKKTGKSVNSAYNRTRTFTFAMLVTAMYTYMRVWRQRMAERTMRETASGRLVPDREPTFSR